jgi:hypothetical protein
MEGIGRGTKFFTPGIAASLESLRHQNPQSILKQRKAKRKRKTV